MHKLISLLSFSVVNKTVHNNRAAVYCDLKDSRAANGWNVYLYIYIYAGKSSRPTCSNGDKSQTVVALRCLCPRQSPAARVSGQVECGAVCRTQCIFNEVRIPSVLHSIALKGPPSRPHPDLYFSFRTQAEEPCTIHNRKSGQLSRK